MVGSSCARGRARIMPIPLKDHTLPMRSIILVGTDGGGEKSPKWLDGPEDYEKGATDVTKALWDLAKKHVWDLTLKGHVTAWLITCKWEQIGATKTWVNKSAGYSHKTRADTPRPGMRPNESTNGGWKKLFIRKSLVHASNSTRGSKRG